MARFCPECGSQLRDGVKFCDKCGAQVQAPNQNSNAFDPTKYAMYKSNEKSMGVAMLISFFLVGLGMVYAGNTEKGLIYFFVGLALNWLVFSFLPIGIHLILSIVVWSGGMYLTYVEVNEVNELNRKKFLFNE